MSGSLLQVLALGAQDAFISGEPEVTLWKSKHRRTTHFAIETIEQQFSGSVAFGRKLTCTISRVADLLKDVKLVLDLPAMSQTAGTVAWTRKVAIAACQSVELEIGGSRIDKLYNHYINIWSELSVDASKDAIYQKMIGNVSTMTSQLTTIPAKRVYLPIPFYFCQDAGLSLILIALQYHDVKIVVELSPVANLYVTDDGLAPSVVGDLQNAFLLCDYVFLDSEERKAFVASAQEQLITQVQFAGAESISSANAKIKLSFNHPVRALVWATQLEANLTSGRNRVFDYTTSGATLNDAYVGNSPMTSAKLTLNGHDRFASRESAYFNLIQPYDTAVRGPAEGVYLYSFATQSFGKQSYVQPSGTLNMSRIDNATLELTMASSAAATVHVFAVSFNTLRYVSGLAGLSFAS